jgi:hypothetical protein
MAAVNQWNLIKKILHLCNVEGSIRRPPVILRWGLSSENIPFNFIVYELLHIYLAER